MEGRNHLPQVDSNNNPNVSDGVWVKMMYYVSLLAVTSEPLVCDGDSGGGYAYVKAENMENSVLST